jgi:hypothetical protein
MKTRLILSSVIASTVLAFAGIAPASAQHANTPAVDTAQRQIRARIDQGIASGRITPAEARSLYQREREIELREVVMKRDGRATEQERRQLRQDLDDMRAEVEEKLANRQVAAPHSIQAPGLHKSANLVRSRIDHGIDTGRITRREAEILFARERKLRSDEAAFRSDGHLSGAERRYLRDEVAMLDEDIARMTSNRQRY